MNVLEGPTQGEILRLSLHEFKKDEELFSWGRTHCLWGRLTKIQTLGETDVQSCQISVLLWASLTVTSWHSELWVTYSVCQHPYPFR